MQLSLKTEHAKAFLSETGCTSALITAKVSRGWNNTVDFTIDSLSQKDFELLHGWLKSNNKGELAGAYRKVEVYQKLKAKPTGSPVTSLEAMVTALKAYIAPSKNRWLFTERSDGMIVPYYVEGIEYRPRRRDEPAYTEMKLCAWRRGENTRRSITWGNKDIGKGKGDVVSHLQSHGYFLETPDAVARYNDEVVQYHQVQGLMGEQFLATGTANSSGRWSYGTVSMDRDGRLAKVVMDDEGGSDDDDERTSRKSSKAGVASSAFWNGSGGGDDDGDGAEEETPNDVVVLPIHPDVRVFDLEKHSYVEIHVSNLTPYAYDSSLFNKLVLPGDVKDLIGILVNSSKEQLEDIVAGKTGGTIIIATGPPGTGKTLTAEVFSETIKRPLYVVQCSQLGTDEESLEKHLSKVLNRASRWNAILLIDEADVYVHERGKDIRQNAIVGVFLRVLEYYRGILFMTSNRSTIIDDAIMSRATAWVQYEMPTAPEREEIWKILSAQFGITLSEKTMADLRLPQLSNLTGRNIKNLLKLAKRLANGGEVTYSVLIRASRFLGIKVKAK